MLLVLADKNREVGVQGRGVACGSGGEGVEEGEGCVTCYCMRQDTCFSGQNQLSDSSQEGWNLL